ncbi:MAG: N-formylglutamate deformylase [Alphaproteobacteria bacterium]
MTTDPFFAEHTGDAPLLISIPHGGTEVPGDIAAGLTDRALTLPDTDWHVARLYDFARALGANTIAARLSRYVIDLNRPSDGHSLYPGQATTGLVPTTTFDGAPLHRAGQAPDAAEITRRVAAYWRPYHVALEARLQTIRRRHGVALLWDAHSIRSRVPRLFEGRLPDFNLGSNGGASADRGLVTRVAAVATAAKVYSSVLDGRFKGGHITRAYGDPAQGIHAVQLELAQLTYMDEDPPFTYRPERAVRVQRPIKAMLEAALDWLAAA